LVGWDLLWSAGIYSARYNIQKLKKIAEIRVSSSLLIPIVKLLTDKTSQPADKPASGQASQRTSQPADKPASGQASQRTIIL